MTTETITELPLDQLHESPFNPRKAFDEADMQQLVADIKATGRVLQPLLVRPIVPPLFKGDDNGIAGYEIVFGHRRFRAAGLANLATVPCMVRALTDEEARRAQISENLSRKDVHAIEEAEGFQALIDSQAESADTIAEKFGKSRSYVYGRLKLLEACPEIRKACLAGEIGSEVALLVARLRSPKLQEKALAAIRSNYIDMKDGGSKSYRHIRTLLVDKFTLDLKGAMFDIEDEMLLPLAGNCVRCTKRTANAPEYADLVENTTSRHGNTVKGSANACTDPDCFDAKKKAHLKREAEKLEAAGKVVVQGNAARTAISATGQIKGAYVPLADVQAELKKLPRKGLEGDANQPQIVLIQDPRTGKTHKAVKADQLLASGVKVKAPKVDAFAAQRARDQAEQAKRIAKRNETQQVNNAVLDRTMQAMASQPRTTQELYWMAEIVFEATEWDVRKELAVRHGFEKPTDLQKVLGQWAPERLGLFAIECVLANDAQVDEYRHYPDGAHQRLLHSAKHYGVDADQVRAEVTGVVPAPASAARAPAKGKAAPAPKKAKIGTRARLRVERAEKQKDEAGSAGSGAQVDAFEGAEA